MKNVTIIKATKELHAAERDWWAARQSLYIEHFKVNEFLRKHYAIAVNGQEKLDAARNKLDAAKDALEKAKESKVGRIIDSPDCDPGKRALNERKTCL